MIDGRENWVNPKGNRILFDLTRFEFLEGYYVFGALYFKMKRSLTLISY